MIVYHSKTGRVEPARFSVPCWGDRWGFPRPRGVDVYVNVNNHYEGSAPLTIERIKELL